MRRIEERWKHSDPSNSQDFSCRPTRIDERGRDVCDALRSRSGRMPVNGSKKERPLGRFQVSGSVGATRKPVIRQSNDPNLAKPASGGKGPTAMASEFLEEAYVRLPPLPKSREQLSFDEIPLLFIGTGPFEPDQLRHALKFNASQCARNPNNFKIIIR